MKNILYKVANEIYSSQYLVAYLLDIKPSTLRSKIERAGGIDKIDSILIDDIEIKIIKKIVNKLKQK